MFSYTDPVYQQQANSPTKEVKLEDLQRLPHHQSLHPINTNSYLTSTSSAHNQSSHVNNSNHAANHVNSSQNNQTSHVNSNQNNHVNNNSSNPLYPYNDMLYSIDHQQQPQMTPSSTYENHYRQQSQGETQLPWQDNCSSQAAQTANNRSNTNSLYPDIRNHPLVDHNPPFDHYNNASPFSSPVPHNNTNVLMSNNHSTPTSQRSSLQSLPSIPPIPSSINNTNNNTPMMQQQQQQQQQQQRPRITTSLWDDEGTVCYQVDVRGICVARRQDNDMVNGTKLLNVTGMSRGKRDGILKNEKGRVVVKVGAMHLKGVWITFARAKALAIQFNIAEHLHPLFVDEPAMYFYSNQLTPHNYFVPNHPIYLQSQDSFTSNNNRTSPSNSSTTASNEYTQPTTSNNLFSNMFSSNNNNNTYNNQMYHLPSAPPVPSMIPYGYGTPTHSNYSERTSHSPTGGIDLHYSG